MDTFETSASELKVAAALMRAQEKFDRLLKDTANPFYKSKYATLDQVISATRPSLRAEGLVVIQRNIRREGEIGVRSRLIHVESGEELTSELTAPPEKFTSQGIGSVITYVRRYDYQTIVGIAPEDDDGSAASGTTTRSDSEQPSRQARPQSVQPPPFSPKPEGPVRANIPQFVPNSTQSHFPAPQTHSSGTPAPAALPTSATTPATPAVSTTLAVPTAMPSKDEYDAYIRLALAIVGELEKAGLKAGRGLPTKTKLRKYITQVYGVAKPEELNRVQWDGVFLEFTKLLETPEGQKKAVELVEAASAKESK